MAGRGRTRVRRAFPYLVIAVAGFALAYLIVYVVLLRTSPPPQASEAEDTTSALLPVKTPDTAALSDTMLAPDTGIATPTIVTIPDLTGMSLDDAQSRLAQLGLSVVVRSDTNSLQPPNTVLRQLPEAGQTVVGGTSVLLTASTFPPVSPSDTPRAR